MHRVLRLALLCWLATTARADVPPLQYRGYTNDFANVLSPAAVARIDALAAELDRKTGAQIAVAIVRSLDGEPIENYANTLARRWGVGRKEDKGVLFMLAVQDRRDRIEVGYGLEPILPDGRVGGILRSLQPYLRQGDYDGAVLLGVQQMAAFVAEASGVTLEGERLQRPPPRQRRRGAPFPVPWWAILLGVIAFFWVISKVGIWPLFMMGGFPGWGGRTGDGGGSGWDGGGFSGFGGGDFGGGGASSDW